MERRVVGSQLTSVCIRAFPALLGRETGGVIPDDPDRDHILPARQEDVRDVEPPAHESTLDAADPVSVQKHFRLPVDTVEVEARPPPCGRRRRREDVAVPEIGVEERLGDEHLVVPEVRVRQGAGIQIADKNGGRDGGDDPVIVAVPRSGQLFAI